jgi:hypothetical protein
MFCIGFGELVFLKYEMTGILKSSYFKRKENKKIGKK